MMVSLRYCMRGFFKCHFIRIRARFGFFGDDAGDSSKMRLEGRFSVDIFIVFMICRMPYGLLFAACMIFVQ